MKQITFSIQVDISFRVKHKLGTLLFLSLSLLFSLIIIKLQTKQFTLNVQADISFRVKHTLDMLFSKALSLIFIILQTKQFTLSQADIFL